MKTFLLILTALPLALHSQTVATKEATNAAPSAPVAETQTNAPAHSDLRMRESTEIFSDCGDFDLKTQLAVYTGNVRVIDPQMKLTCDVLTARVPDKGGRVDHIVAERNVVIDAVDSHGEPIHATADKAVYTFKVENLVTNELIELTGDPKLQTKYRSATGDSITWNRINNSFHGTNLHMIFQQPLKEASTNKPPASLSGTNTP